MATKKKTTKKPATENGEKENSATVTIKSKDGKTVPCEKTK